MVLSDIEIIKAIESGEIKIIPFKRGMVGPCSVDLSLDSVFGIFKTSRKVDPENHSSVEESLEIVDTKGKPYIIKPGEFILARTRERVAISKSLAATLEGKSSVARLGLVVHAAGLVNPGTGLSKPVPLVLEIFCQNKSPVVLHPGMGIIQIIFHRLAEPASVGYDERPSSKFSGRRGLRLV